MNSESLTRFRKALPPAAFQPDASKLFWMFLHVVVIAAANIAAGMIGLSWWLIVPIIVAAISLSAVGFATHDLAHGSVMRSGRAQRTCELFFWGLLLIAPTIWRRVHNQAHHVHFNTPSDPDRQFLHEEKGTATKWYTWLLYPNEEIFPWNPLVFVHFVFYITRNTIAALLPVRWKPSVVPNLPEYRRGDTLTIAFEWAVIIALQFGFYLLCGRQLLPWLVMTIGMQAATSAISMAYIFTNHFINPLTHEADPIVGSTSVIVPRWLDRLHSNFSYHTEHHVFPTMNSAYYPALSRLLVENYPGTYQRIPIAEAWRRLWQNRAFIEKPTKSESAGG
jgi:fatty acid desaturase